ncbi:MAG: bifunctional hydroxymethylpyrimidine kinase/phosphomethylpyrimidine kinase [Nitrospirota bacterium]
MKKVLTVAGFDPSGSAGIQADLKVFRSFGLYGLSVVSALTAQNTRGVSGIMPVDAKFFEKQLEVLLSDIKPDATKIGMIYSGSNVCVIAKIIKKYSLKNVVIDPVMLSSSGRRLSPKNTLLAIKEKLLPFCAVLTPNIHEASVLAGIDIKTQDDMEKTAIKLKEYGVRNIIITGGHLERIAMDILYDGNFHYLGSKKISGEYHGTGCAFSAAIAAQLAKGHSALNAARIAKRFMNKAIRQSFRAGGGMKLLNV